MNILFLSVTFPDAVNSVRGTFNIDLCAALAREHSVRVIAPRSWHEWLKVKRSGRTYGPSAEARAHGLEVDYPVFWYMPKVQPQNMDAAMWRSLRRSMQQFPASFRPDVVISYWAFPDGAAGIRLGEHYGVPSVMIAGGSDVLLLPNDAARGPAVKAVLRQSSMVVTVSEGLRRAAIELGARPERVRTIQQGVDPLLFKPGDKATARRALGLPVDAEILLWVGRMVAVKNLPLLLSAVHSVAARRPRLRLYLVGDGELRGMLQARVAELDLGHVVSFAGAQGHDQLPDWFRATDLTVLSSHSEGLPNVLRESLACGSRFVATNVGDIREIAEPAHAALAPPGDVTAFAAAIEDMLEKAGQAAQLKYTARTWARTARDFTSLIEELSRSKAA